MSMFMIKDIDTILIPFLNPFHDFLNLLLTNNYYCDFITNHELYQNLRKLIFSNSEHIYESVSKYDNMFINACRCNNSLCFYLYVNYEINIHANNEGAFEWSCVNGHLDVAKWLITLCPMKYRVESIGNNKIEYLIS